MLDEAIGALRASFARREVALSELPLHLEPLLWQTGDGSKEDEEQIRKLVNELELVRLTTHERDQHEAAAKVLAEAAAFVRARSRNERLEH